MSCVHKLRQKCSSESSGSYRLENDFIVDKEFHQSIVSAQSFRHKVFPFHRENFEASFWWVDFKQFWEKRLDASFSWLYKKVMMDKWVVFLKKSTSVSYVSCSHICLVYNSGEIWAVFSKANTSMEGKAECHSDFTYLLRCPRSLCSWGWWLKYPCNTKIRPTASFFHLETIPILGGVTAWESSHKTDVKS